MACKYAVDLPVCTGSGKFSRSECCGYYPTRRKNNKNKERLSHVRK